MPKPLDRRIRNREHDAKRRTEQPWRAWYSTAQWRALRRDQLTAHPLCSMCGGRGELTPATVCDHVIPHRGDPALFWDAGNLQSLCPDCHDRDKQAIEKGGRARQTIGLDGWPVGQG